jgi:hypothetical protein
MTDAIDNFDLLKPFLIFESDDDFYHLQIIRRGKDNPMNIRDAMLLKSYYVHSADHFSSIAREVQYICISTHSRAYLNVNRRSFEKVAFQTLSRMSNLMMSRAFHAVKSAYDSACGESSSDKNKKWIIDVDFDRSADDLTNMAMIARITAFLYKINPEVFIRQIPTINGVHLITTPFDVRLFNNDPELRKLDIHKNNPTLLYYGG